MASLRLCCCWTSSGQSVCVCAACQEVIVALTLQANCFCAVLFWASPLCRTAAKFWLQKIPLWVGTSLWEPFQQGETPFSTCFQWMCFCAAGLKHAQYIYFLSVVSVSFIIQTLFQPTEGSCSVQTHPDPPHVNTHGTDLIWATY